MTIRTCFRSHRTTFTAPAKEASVMMLRCFDVPRDELLHDITLPKSPRVFTLLKDRVQVGERQTANE
jgi:hypothetical protein